MTKQELLETLNNTGVADIGCESFSCEDATFVVVRLQLKDGREFVLNQDVCTRHSFGPLLIQESVKGDLEDRLALPVEGGV